MTLMTNTADGVNFGTKYFNRFTTEAQTLEKNEKSTCW